MIARLLLLPALGGAVGLVVLAGALAVWIGVALCLLAGCAGLALLLDTRARRANERFRLDSEARYRLAVLAAQQRRWEVERYLAWAAWQRTLGTGGER